MKILTRCCLVLLLAPALAAAQPACEDPGSSMLWRVEGGGPRLHLYGSIHVGRADFYPLPEAIEATFRDAEKLVFEVDPRAAATPAVLLQMQQRGMLPAGQTLEDVLSPATLARLRAVLAELGLPAQYFMGMKPWLVTLMLTGVQMTMHGYLPQYGIESYLLGAMDPATEVLELESIGEQIGFLEELNAESFLAYTLESFEQGEEEIEALMRAWQCANQEELQALLFADFAAGAQARADMAALREKLFYERNRDMAADIRGWLDGGQGDYFVVIGSGHLLGEDSVVDLLRESGFRVEPVRLD